MLSDTLRIQTKRNFLLNLLTRQVCVRHRVPFGAKLAHDLLYRPAIRRELIRPLDDVYRLHGMQSIPVSASGKCPNWPFMGFNGETGRRGTSPLYLKQS